MSNPVVWYKKLDAWSKVWMDRLFALQTFQDLFIVLLMLAGMWAAAWFGHVIVPWYESLLGLDPTDPLPEAKVRWRQIWSSAICFPGIVGALYKYFDERRKQQESKK